MRNAFVISLAKVFLQPDVEADEKIAAAHLFDFQLCGASAPVAPGYGQRSPAKTAHDRLEGYLHSDVEMGRDKRATPFDNFPPVGLKGVGGVVEPYAEKDFEEKIGE